MRTVGSLRIGASLVTAALALPACGGPVAERDLSAPPEALWTVALPAASAVGDLSLEEALAQRRSVRRFTVEAVSAPHLGQLLWAAQGTTQEGGRGRTAPSAGGTYPLEVFALTSNGIFRYVPGEHVLEVLAQDDRRPALCAAALDQAWVREAPLVLVVVVVTARTAERYGERAERYAVLEAGHAAQNILLQAVALGLGAVPVGAFDDIAVRRVIGLPEEWAPLYLIPVGHPAPE